MSLSLTILSRANQLNLFYNFRWLKTFNVKTDAQNKQRKVAKEWSGDDVIVEEAPFTFGDLRIKIAALAIYSKFEEV